MVFCEYSVEAVVFLDGLPLRALTNAFRVADVMNGITLGLEKHALKAAGQKTVRPLPRRYRLLSRFSGRGQDDKAGQIIRICSQTIKQPGAHAGSTLDDRAAV